MAAEIAVFPCPGHKGIVLTFGPAEGNPDKPPSWRSFSKPLRAAGKQFMGIALVPHIEDKFVLRGIENIMKRNRQFHRAQIGSQVAAGAGYAVNQKIPDLLTEQGQLFRKQLFQLLRDC